MPVTLNVHVGDLCDVLRRGALEDGGHNCIQASNWQPVLSVVFTTLP